MEKQSEKYEGWFKLTEKIGAFHAFEGSKFIVKSKTYGRYDFFYVPLGKQPFARLDYPHKGFNFHHLNINPKYTGKTDPHLYVPPSLYKSFPYAIKTAEIVGEVSFYLAVAYDAIKLGTALSEDYKNKTSNHTIDAATSISGIWIGGYTGGALGAKVGTLMCPGFGSFLGGLGGAMYGAYYGEPAAGYIKDKIMENNYENIKKKAKDVEVVASKIYSDACKLGIAVSNDYKNKTATETVDVASSISGVYVGGLTGGALGAKVGTLIWPGFGTIVGGLGGVVYGAYYGDSAAQYVKEQIKAPSEEKIGN